jgi:tRNA dimethylallyltransferase
MTKPKVVAVLGPTAVGKSDFALWLAKRINGEIVSADSRQLYRHMDIGTDKPSDDARREVPHHLLDVAEPDQVVTAAQFRQMAHKVLEEIVGRGHVPIFVGGTNLYFKIVLEGWEVPPVPPDPNLRQQLEARLRREGLRSLVDELLSKDAAAAETVDLNNPRRVIRALEILAHAKGPLRKFRRKGAPPFRVLKIGLTAPREELYRRIDDRIERQVRSGLIGETKRLLDAGFSPDLPSMTGLGYRQIAQYLMGKVTLQDALRTLRSDTRRYARQQLTWLRRDSEIHWFDVTSEGWREAALKLVRQFLEDP